MNKRIRELAEQAEQYADYNFKGEHFWTEAYEQKFAELIVRECAEVARLNTRVDSKVYLMIQEHFGV